MDKDLELEKLVQKVQSNRKYEFIMTDLVIRLAEKAQEKGLKGKAAVKDVRNKLHQVGGAYFKRRIDFAEVLKELKHLPQDLKSEPVQDFCIKHMASHASTAERLSILESFFYTCLKPISPLKSILDLACGMTPLSIPWMPLNDQFTYQACDIYIDMLSFIQSFFNHFQINGKSFACDLIGGLPTQKAQLALILKSIPCLEQVEKEIGLSLLEEVQADHILVSFPAQSLGGQQKGMPDFYKEHFYDMVSEKSWQINQFEFETELAFLVTK